jgi:starvation-inducible outer membrane lipoprotein
MKKTFLLILITFLFSGCYNKPDETFKVNNTTLKIVHRASFIYVYSQTKYGWKQEMSFEKDLNVTKNDIIKIMQLKQEGKL